MRTLLHYLAHLLQVQDGYLYGGTYWCYRCDPPSEREPYVMEGPDLPE